MDALRERRSGAADSFNRWLSEQAHRHDPVGDLARDTRADHPCDVEGAPQRRGIVSWRRHLYAHGACSGAYRALDDAYREWCSMSPHEEA